MTNPPDPKTKTPRTDQAEAAFTEGWENARGVDWPSAPTDAFDIARTLELENQSLTRRMEEAVNEVGALKAQLGDLGFRSAELLDDCEAKDAKLTALRTAAEGASKALEAILNYRLQLPAGLRPQGELALAALRAELDQADSNASNSPTASRESQG